MADWTITWVPQRIYTPGSRFRTLVSPFENGAEQRRKKWGAVKNEFILEFSGLTPAVINAIRNFYEAREGKYDVFTFPNYAEYIKGTVLTLSETANPDTIVDSGAGFSTLGFVAGQDVTIAGSGAGNDGVIEIDVVAAGTLTVGNGDLTADESANADLIVYRTYDVRFDDDYFGENFLYLNQTTGLGAADTSRIRLIEVF